MAFTFGISNPAIAKVVSYTIWGGVVLIILGILIGLAIWWYKRRKWNLEVIVKLPRAGNLIYSETAKGHYDVGAGIVDIKRKGVKSVGMKPFDVREYLQGEKALEVIQISTTEFIPIHPKSYEKVITTKIVDGAEVEEEHYIVKIETDLLKRKTWKTYMERAAKSRFTIAGWMDVHWRAIELSIIVFIIFIGFSAMWMRLPSICTPAG